MVPDNQRVRFAPHGGGPAYWEGQVFWVRPQGTFNLEGILAMEARMRLLISAHSPQRWVRLEVFEDKNTLGPPGDDNHIIKDHLQFSYDNGCRAFVLVNSNILIKEILEVVCTQIGLRLVYFPEIREALAWISSEGYALGPP